MTAQDLGECRRLIEEHGLARSFLLDAFVLLRLEGPPGDEDLRLCAELADLLQVDDETLSDLIALALHILGINTLDTLFARSTLFNHRYWLEFIGIITPNFTKQHTLGGHDDYVRSVAFSPDGRWLASGSQDNTVRLYELSYTVTPR